MVEVFKTDVRWQKQAKMLRAALSRQFPFINIHFDLNDCDRILRIEGSDFCPLKVIELLEMNGHFCVVLD
ncbi:hypothetical protein BEL04_12720 [Mucilaginibacter sp. PPCGB 2223]|uniref:hypothetical protein n=1 Tax=Mucilaginibacter sp. PPCGB 2223 TaxID=1886027 RepID=UPI0008253C1D|nr:hypothetical protein [Mucilaginibacter sp. PPCGB 2223]OCX52330.1 hypothetical protein BEL04_12720 [Mucilaginibacter sp. PPCGB 2223]